MILLYQRDVTGLSLEELEENAGLGRVEVVGAHEAHLVVVDLGVAEREARGELARDSTVSQLVAKTVLAELAVNDKPAFSAIVEQVKARIGETPASAT